MSNSELSLPATDKNNTSKVISDAKERAQAIDPTKSFLVQAPAGSGKTELVTDRILALLARVEKPENILAITFTRKATAEMRNRVIEKLLYAKQTNVVPQELHKLNSWQLGREVLQRNDEKKWNLLEYPARLRIQTFDSFCSGLVRVMPWTSLSGGSLQISANFFEQYKQAAKATLGRLEKESVQKFLKRVNINLDFAEGLLVDMLASRDQWIDFAPQGDTSAAQHTSNILQNLVKSLDKFVEKSLKELLSHAPQSFMQKLPEVMAEWAPIKWKKRDGTLFQPLLPLLDLKNEPLGYSIVDVERWRALAQAVLTSGNDLRSARGLNANLGLQSKSPIKDKVQALIAMLDGDSPFIELLPWVNLLPLKLISDQQLVDYQKLFEVVQIALDELQKIFRQDASVDFSEVAMRAVAGLGTEGLPSDLLLRLDARIDHLLVDEFQDTSHLQIKLLKKLISGWQDGDGRTIFMVGDPMQSIYRFRKAEVGLFLKVAQEEKLGEVSLKVLNLEENFRSLQGVVEWNNQFFASIFPKNYDTDLGAIKYSPSAAFHPSGLKPAVMLHPFYYFKSVAESVQQTVLTKDELEQIMAKYTVKLIQQALLDHQDSKNPVAVLVNNRSHLGGLIAALRQAQIPIRAVDMAKLSHRYCVIDLLQVVYALSHAEDRVAWLSLLRSPLCGLTLNSLHAVFGDQPKITLSEQIDNAMQLPDLELRLGINEAKRFKHIVNILRSQQLSASSLTFATSIKIVWQQLGGDVFYNSQADQADIEAVLSTIEELFPYGQVDKTVLEEAVEGLFSVAESNAHAVEIMTMHKAKGLQFQEVILYGLHRSSRNDVPGLIKFERFDTKTNTQTGAKEKNNNEEDGLLIGLKSSKAVGVAEDPLITLLMAREKERQKYEALRLLYVAATRACQSLHICFMQNIEFSEKEGYVYKAPVANSLLSYFSQLPDLLHAGTVDEDRVNDLLDGSYYKDIDSIVPRLQDSIHGQCKEGASGRQDGVTNTNNANGAIGTNAASRINANNGVSNVKRLHWEQSESPSLMRFTDEFMQRLASKHTALLSTHTTTSLMSWGFDDPNAKAIGMVAHAWLQQIGQAHLVGWDEARIKAGEVLQRRQLLLSGIGTDILKQALERVQTLLCNALKHERIRTVLSDQNAQYEWPLHDDNGKLLILDVAISTPQGWQVVDYKTSTRLAQESLEQFSQRLKLKYTDQMQSYCDYLQRLDGRPAKAALFALAESLWIDVIV